MRADESRPNPARVKELVASALMVTRNELKYHCEVICDLADDLPDLTCFPHQIEQVLMNLLVNAAHAIPEKGTIRIAAARVDESSIAISVSDDGTGIRPSDLNHVFDPFFTTKEVGKGTGLGLHIAHSIVERHGGRIEVESQVGVGTTFTMTLPLELP